MARLSEQAGSGAARAGAGDSIEGQQQRPGVFPYDAQLADQQAPAEAVALLELLAQPGEPIHLQTFSDGPDSCYMVETFERKSGGTGQALKWRVTGIPKAGGKTSSRTGRAARTLDTTLEELPQALSLEALGAANMARCGVFFCVNALSPDAQRRSNDTVARVRGLFLDLDGSPLPDSWPLMPTAIVESSPGRFHVYWAAADFPLDRFTAAQQALAQRYGGDLAVCDLARVMRLPGMAHQKADAPHVARLIHTAPACYTFEELTEAFELGPIFAAQDEQKQQRAAEAEQARARAQALRDELSSGQATDRQAALQKHAQAALLDEVAAVTTAPQGQRNITLNRSAFSLGTLAGAGTLDPAQARAELLAAAEAVGLGQHEAAATVDSGLSAGQAKPRDLSNVGQLAGKKQQQPATVSPALADKAQALAPAQLSAADIPDPEGEGGAYYTDAQLLEFLGLSDWPVMGAATDKAHALRLEQLADGNLAYVPELGGYVAWDGRQWIAGGGKAGRGTLTAQQRAAGLGQFMRPELTRLLELFGVLSKETARLKAAQARAEELNHATHRQKCMEAAYFAHFKAARALEGVGKQRAVLEAAAPQFAQPVELFEARPWVVGFQNGTWDAGSFREARRSDYLLTLAPVAYDPSADRSDWLEVLGRMTGGDAQLAQTLQDVAGYALSGASSHRLLPWLYGPGGTGKSTFTELLSTALGGYAATVDTKMFASDSARERLGAAIWGKRAVLCSEAGNARLDAELLKTLSGSDRLPARQLFAEAFTFNPSHVLLMVANDAPRVEAYDDALKDRVLALPFTHPLAAGGPLLGGQRLEALRRDPSSALVAGFTAWAVEGLARVHSSGEIYRAPICQQATRDFWADVDPLTDFWAGWDESRSQLALGVPVTVLRESYTQWCEQQGVRALGAQKFTRACESVGLERKKQSQYSGGKRSQVAVWQLTMPGKWPSCDHCDRFEPNSEKSTRDFLEAEIYLESYTETASKRSHQSQQTVTADLAPASGEL